MDKWSEIRAKLVDAQEELYQIGDQYRQSKDDLDTKWSFLHDFHKGLNQKCRMPLRACLRLRWKP